MRSYNSLFQMTPALMKVIRKAGPNQTWAVVRWSSGGWWLVEMEMVAYDLLY